MGVGRRTDPPPPLGGVWSPQGLALCGLSSRWAGAGGSATVGAAASGSCGGRAGGTAGPACCRLPHPESVLPPWFPWPSSDPATSLESGSSLGVKEQG